MLADFLEEFKAHGFEIRATQKNVWIAAAHCSVRWGINRRVLINFAPESVEFQVGQNSCCPTYGGRCSLNRLPASRHRAVHVVELMQSHADLAEMVHAIYATRGFSGRLHRQAGSGPPGRP